MATILIANEPKCVGGGWTVLARVGDAVSCEWTDQIGGDRGGCKLVLPRSSAVVSKCAIFNVIRITDDDGGIYEYRITGLTDGPTQSTVVVEAVDLSHDLGRVRLAAAAGGIQQLTFAPGLLTPSQIIDTYVLPALTAAGITWVVKGTITPTANYSLSWQRSTPLAVLAALESATKYEFWLERNGDTNYKIMLGTRSAAGTPVAWVGRNVETLERRIVADERFYNRAIAVGGTLTGETEATGVGQHGWRISTVAGDNLTLAHPAGGANPIGADDQLNGLVANVAFDGIVLPELCGYGAPSQQRNPIAYDPTRRIVYWVALSGASSSQSVVAWHDLTSGARGTFTPSSTTQIYSLLYVASRDEIWVACYDAQKVERYSASTKTSAGSFTTVNTNPSRMRDLTADGVGKVAVSFNNGTGSIELWNTSTLTRDATLTHSASNDHWCVYDSGSSRYFTGSHGSGAVYYFSSAYAYVGQVTPFGGAGCTQPILTSGTLYVAKYALANVRSITCSTAAMGTDTTVTYSGGSFTWATYPDTLPFLGSRLWLLAASSYKSFLFAVDPSASYAITSAVRVEAQYGGAVYDTTDDLFLTLDAFQAPVVYLYYRNGGMTPSGRLRFTVQDTVNATQVVTKPSATKGPIVAEQLVEFRENAQDSYLTALTDPASVAAYGPVDGYPAFPDVYKRNYKNDPFHKRWNGNSPITVGVQNGTYHSNVTSIGTLKWDRSIAQASSRSTSAQVNGTQALGAGVRTLNVKGLTAGRVVQSGTIIYRTTSAAIVFSVLANATADGSGLAALTVYTNIAGSVTDNDALTLHCPSQADIAQDYAVTLPLYGTTGSNFYPCLPYGAVHLPAISGATQAWVRVKFYCMAVAAYATDIKIRFRGMGFASGSGYAELTGASSSPGTAATPAAYELTFEQQVDMSGLPAGSDGYLGFFLPNISTWTMSAFISCWLLSVEAYVATAASCPTPQGRVPGDELTPWTGCNNLLFTQGRGAPTVDYAVRFLEDGTAVRVGQAALLRDPTLGIAASPRIVAVTRSIRRDPTEIARPIVQLNNRPLSAMEGLAGVGD